MPSLVKALDRFAAHLRAALTSLGTRMQNTFPYEGMPQCVRSPKRSDAYLRALLSVYANPYAAHRQTTSSFGTETVKLLRESLEVVQRTDCCHPMVPISPDLAGSQPSRQAPPRWTGHKLRFAFRWYSALLKRCRPRGQSARRTQRLPHERAPAPKNQRAQVSQGEICPKETPQNHARMPQQWIGARTKA